MDIVVTGAGGLIGRHLLPLLDSHQVFAISRRQPAQSVPHVQWIAADLAAAQTPTNLPSRADVLIHLAQSAHYREFPDGALDVFNVNVASTAQLLDWSRRAGVRHFILASSGAVGNHGQRGSYYVASKASAELLVDSYAEVFKTLTLRFFFVYGAGQKPWMLVPRLLDSVATDRTVHLSGFAGPRLNPIHVSDAAKAIETAVSRAISGRVDIAGPEVITVRQMAEVIGSCLHRTPTFHVDSTQVPADIIGDTASMRQLLITPRVTFADGLRQMVLAGGN